MFPLSCDRGWPDIGVMRNETDPFAIPIIPLPVIAVTQARYARIVREGFWRKLLKTAGGKFVAPAPIENLLKTSPLIANAMVVGDTRKFTSVLVVVNFAGVEEEARKAGREFSTHAQMLSDPWVRDLYTRELERLTAHLAQYEKPKRFALIEKDFTYAGGELTYTMKLKRRVIEERYQDVIARLYADVEEPRPARTA